MRGSEQVHGLMVPLVIGAKVGDVAYNVTTLAAVIGQRMQQIRGGYSRCRFVLVGEPVVEVVASAE